jgi:hypothetical protein
MIEHLLGVLHPRAVVREHDDQATVGSRRTDGEAGSRGVLEGVVGVVQDVEKYLMQLELVSQDANGCLRTLEREAHSRGDEVVVPYRDHFPQNLAHLDQGLLTRVAVRDLE